MPSLYVDGEEEQTEQIQIAAKRQAQKLMQGRPPPEWLIALLQWATREAFRAGFAHAHSKNTVPSSPWSDDEPTQQVQLFDEEGNEI